MFCACRSFRSLDSAWKRALLSNDLLGGRGTGAEAVLPIHEMLTAELSPTPDKSLDAMPIYRMAGFVA